MQPADKLISMNRHILDISAQTIIWEISILSCSLEQLGSMYVSLRVNLVAEP